MNTFPAEKIQAASSGLRAIAHELRLAILCHLSGGPLSVSELLARTGANQSNLSQHLAKMRMLGVLECERRGQQVTYRLANPAFAQIAEALKAIYCPVDTEQNGGDPASCPSPSSHTRRSP